MWKRSWPLWLLVFVLAAGGARVVRSSAAPPPAEDKVAETAETAAPGAPDSQPAQVGTGHPSGSISPPTDMESRLANMMRRDTRGLEVVEHAGGRRSVRLGGRFQHVTKLVPNASGGAGARCCSSYQELAESEKSPISTYEGAPAINR